jgi:hypothetical protein
VVETSTDWIWQIDQDGRSAMALRRFVREAGIERYRIKPIGAVALEELFT